jgi:hypothetical protein
VTVPPSATVWFDGWTPPSTASVAVELVFTPVEFIAVQV